MSTAFVRRVLVVSTVSVASSTVLVAQQPTESHRVHPKFGIALGSTIPNTVGGPSDFGAHLQLNESWYQSSRIAVRADVMAQLMSGAKSRALCFLTPLEPCRATPYQPDQIFSAGISAEFRPFGSAPRLYGLGGVGLYYGTVPSRGISGGYGTLGGIGFDFARAGHAGFSLELKYHRLDNPIGAVRGMYTPSLAYRF